VGVPLLAAALAQQRHAPKLTMVIEGGIIGPQIKPGRLPISTNRCEPPIAHRCYRHHRHVPVRPAGFLDYGFMARQIDRHGNINTSVVGVTTEAQWVRLPGTGGQPTSRRSARK